MNCSESSLDPNLASIFSYAETFEATRSEVSRETPRRDASARSRLLSKTLLCKNMFCSKTHCQDENQKSASLPTCANQNRAADHQHAQKVQNRVKNTPQPLISCIPQLKWYIVKRSGVLLFIGDVTRAKDCEEIRLFRGDPCRFARCPLFSTGGRELPDVLLRARDVT